MILASYLIPTKDFYFIFLLLFEYLVKGICWFRIDSNWFTWNSIKLL